jgi:leader peptidase (prepilin peptidase)/N-methyltransferase
VSWHLDAAVVTAGVGLVAGSFVPRLISRLPEPEPVPEEEDLQAADDEAEFARPVDDPKELYADVAALPGLRWKSALASAVAAGAMGARLGWHPLLPLLLFLVPVCAALTVVDWRTRYLPTALIRPSYAVAGVLAVLASALSGEWHALLVSAVGCAATFAIFFVLWWISPRSLGYGDVRLSGLLAIPLGWLGVAPLVLGVYTAFVLGGIGGLLLAGLKVFHRRHSPFGPAMVLGAWLGVVATSQLGAVYGWVVNGLVSLVP